MLLRAWMLFLLCGCSGAYAYGMLHGVPSRVLRVPVPVMKKGRAVGGGPAIRNRRKKRNMPVALNPGALATTEPTNAGAIVPSYTHRGTRSLAQRSSFSGRWRGGRRPSARSRPCRRGGRRRDSSHTPLHPTTRPYRGSSLGRKALLLLRGVRLGG